MNKIIINNLCKSFNLELRKPKSALYSFLKFFYLDKENKKIDALKNISFSLNSGEVVGIIGRNGSGKSTLLRIIAGIYSADSGNIHINGRMSYLSGFNTGLNEKLTIRENIFLVGSLMDLSQADIDKKFNEIIEFSGLKDFVDVELGKLSSGMIARLAFAITIFCISHKNPDILLLDEVFSSGGDEEFKKKSIDKMEELIKGGATVILVSHDFGLIEKYCDMAILIDKGSLIMKGKPAEVIKEYLNLL